MSEAQANRISLTERPLTWPGPDNEARRLQIPPGAVEFPYAHLVPAPYRAVMSYNAVDTEHEGWVLRIDRLVHRPYQGPKQYGIDILWNLDKESDTNAKIVIDQMLRTLRRVIVSEMTWEGETCGDIEVLQEAVMGLADRNHTQDDCLNAWRLAIDEMRRNWSRDLRDRDAWAWFLALGGVFMGFGLYALLRSYGVL